MTISLKHSKTSTVPDSGDTTLVQPSDWNSEHTLSCASGKIIGRSTTGVGNAEEITIGAGLSLLGGELSATDAGGTVTSVSVVTANGLAGSVANQTTTPAITLSTTVTGLLKGNGTAISAAVAGTDYAGLASANTFANNQVISVSSASDALRITQTGAGNALVVEDSANPDSTPFVVESAGRVLSGSTTSYATFNDYLNTARRPQFQFNGASTPASMFVLANWSALSSSPATFNLAKSRGAEIGTQGLVNSGDDIGVIEFSADDGTNFVPAAIIMAEVDGTPGTNDMPGRLVFSTTADGASSPTERMRIDSSGQVGIGGTAAAGRKVDVTGTLPVGSGFTITYSSRGTIPSGATTAYYGFYSTPTTEATAFTVASLTHFFANPSAFGAGSTVTNQYGFHASNSLTGATNNYGFYSNIASGTGRYNFYAAGSASNYFGGDLTFKPLASATPASNGDLTFEATSNTSVKIKLKGSDGVVRSVTLTLS